MFLLPFLFVGAFLCGWDENDDERRCVSTRHVGLAITLIGVHREPEHDGAEFSFEYSRSGLMPFYAQTHSGDMPIEAISRETIARVCTCSTE